MVSAAEPALVLIVTDTDGRIGGALYETPATAPLALLAGRGTVRSLARERGSDHRDWQQGLLTTLALANDDYPSAPVSLDATDANTGGYWLHADLVHLAAGMDRLTLTPLVGSAAVTSAEREALAPLIVRHMEASDLQLRIGKRGAWFIRSERALAVVTHSPENAAATDLDSVMPSGADAPALRRALTEWQMILHEHPVNTRREQRGLPAINAIWPWGGGTLPTVVPRPLPVAYADDVFTQGVYRLHGRQTQPVPATAEAVLAQSSGRVVVVIDSVDPAGLNQWIAAAVSALRAGKIVQLQIMVHRWQVQVTRAQLRYFWRRPLPPAQWQSA